jgi:hypothetical protein
VEDAPLVRHLALLLHELADEVAQLGVGERLKIWESFHGGGLSDWAATQVSQEPPQPSTST